MAILNNVELPVTLSSNTNSDAEIWVRATNYDNSSLTKTSSTLSIVRDFVYSSSQKQQKTGLHLTTDFSGMYPTQSFYLDSLSSLVVNQLGTANNGWNVLFMSTQGSDPPRIIRSGNGGIYLSSSALQLHVATVSGNNTLYGTTLGNGTPNLGATSYRWGTIYATSGTIQTSDRSAKKDIHYLDEPQIKTMSLTTENNNNIKKVFTTEELINFIKKLTPATFVYSNKEKDTIEENIINNHTELVQLGLIANDIKDEPLFNYIGATMLPGYDEELNVETTENSEEISLGLKPIPLAVLALTACKNLIQRVEELEEQIKNK